LNAAKSILMESCVTNQLGPTLNRARTPNRCVLMQVVVIMYGNLRSEHVRCLYGSSE